MKERDLGLYILDGNREPQKTQDYYQWFEWCKEISNRLVAIDFIGEIKLSTVFIAMDYSLEIPIDGKPAIPILYETRIFGGEKDGDTWRWTTKQEALNGHAQIFNELRQENKLQ